MGLLLRLAGPLQSWGEHSVFGHRDTLRFPTRSGLIGIFAAAEGRPRGTPLDDYDSLRLTIRIDRPGIIMRDYHTIGGGYPRELTVPTAEGKRRQPGSETILTHRYYCSDAVFVVAVEGPSERTDAIARALESPYWPVYLGRRSCPPDQPLLLNGDVDDPVVHLLTRVPVARRPPRPDTPYELDFVTEGSRGDAESVAELTDVPQTFSRLERKFRTRTVSIAPRPVPAELWSKATNAYHDALIEYIQEAR
ncbi:CRISPR-associated Cas5e family protein [Actinomadura pelletieri DSM 43383]|uniref:CRISPR-associated Cas5e family protein n=1 Tax=Actinomadura pelletieri DSM 43383 TaxID=1120940 RepID=A0A495Q9X0_9ACTN|nr:type I-E CRISPR-associated protein Cas5/CasD [Actinomadura pelletieri]RKS68104.1 CRISPR-associated Cas5e family protein [Actinomadura pelletieri DSM 43383]